jgi:hypothetical protein
MAKSGEVLTKQSVEPDKPVNAALMPPLRR